MAKAPPQGVPKPEDFFKLPDFQLPELPHALKDYGKLVEIVWTSAPAVVEQYTKSAKETWNAYTETYVKRFDALPAADKTKFLKSGLDGAVVFLTLTMISRFIMNRYIDPYLLGAYRWPRFLKTRRRHYDNPTAGRSMSYDKMKWLFTSSVLAVVWHTNTHHFFNFGVPADLAALAVVCGGLSVMNYRRTHSVAAVLAFYLIPLLVLVPVSATVAVMQNGPYIKDMKSFPYFVGAVTALTAIYFMFEAPPTPVVMASKNGYQREIPFGVALREEMRQVWRGDWSGTLMSMPRRVIGRAASTQKRGARGRVKSGGGSDYSRNGKTVSAFPSGKLLSVFGPAYQLIENICMFFMGLVYRMIKFIKHVLHLLIDSLVGGVSSLPGMSQYFPNEGKQGGRNGRGKSVETSKSRSQSRTPRLSRRVSKTRD